MSLNYDGIFEHLKGTHAVRLQLTDRLKRLEKILEAAVKPYNNVEINLGIIYFFSTEKIFCFLTNKLRRCNSSNKCNTVFAAKAEQNREKKKSNLLICDPSDGID